MARIAGVNIPQNKLVKIGLTYIYGIGDKFSNDICKSLSIPSSKRVNELTDEEILKIREYIDGNAFMRWYFDCPNIKIGIYADLMRYISGQRDDIRWKHL